jgi:hypothetical protein
MTDITLDRKTARIVRDELVNVYLNRRAKIFDLTTRNSDVVRERLVVLSDTVYNLDTMFWGDDLTARLTDSHPLPKQ